MHMIVCVWVRMIIKIIYVRSLIAAGEGERENVDVVTIRTIESKRNSVFVSSNYCRVAISGDVFAISYNSEYCVFCILES